MKILSVKQLRAADRETVKKQGITSLELMERAGTKVFEVIDRLLQKSSVPVKVFCGIGNNGGDGLVTARFLLEKGYQVSVYVVSYSEKRSPDFVENYQRFIELNNKWPTAISHDSEFPKIDKGDFIVDAIFGIGLNRSLNGWVGRLIEHINDSEAYVLAVDIPSGLFADKGKSSGDMVIKANLTCTFQSPKLVFFLPETGIFAGEITILDIGLDREFISGAPAVGVFVTKWIARNLYRQRERFSHKGTFGHVLVIGGSYGKMGSICLCTEAVLRAGAGMATAFIPKCGYEIVQMRIPEAMVLTDEHPDYIHEIRFDFDPSVICFGVGAGKKKETREAYKNLLSRTKRPMLIDADGLNLISENPGLIDLVPKNSVLTPHPKELERLVGPWKDDFEKIEKTRAFVKAHKLIVVIKGAYTITVSADDLFINSTGNPALATAGSGDVLAGVITGLISQGYDPLSAAIFGVYLHGKAGDFAALKPSAESVIAGDICRELGAAFSDLKIREERDPNN